MRQDVASIYKQKEEVPSNNTFPFKETSQRIGRDRWRIFSFSSRDNNGSEIGSDSGCDLSSVPFAKCEP